MGCLKLTNYKQKLPRQWTLLCRKIKTTKHPFIQELNQENVAQKEFVWDPTAGSATRPLFLRLPVQAVNLLYCHDANKNVTEVSYLATANGIGAHYEYDTFGNIITNTRNSLFNFDSNNINPFRFSSEYFDSELGLVYYNYRHYNPQTGCWVSRDPIAEEGGGNLYGMCKNNLLNHIDLLGEDAIAIGVGGTIGTLVCPGAGTLIGITVGVLIVAGVTTYLYIAECKTKEKTETITVTIPNETQGGFDCCGTCRGWRRCSFQRLQCYEACKFSHGIDCKLYEKKGYY